MIKIFAVIGSLLIHAAFLLILASSWVTPPPPKSPPVPQLHANLLVPKKSTAQQIDKTPVDKHGRKVYKRDEVICSNKDGTYVGVGIIIQPGADRIISAPEQYPGYIAGLRVGDYLVDPFSTHIVDGYLDFDVRRGIEVMQFHIKVENICYKTLD
jgi:hypothetical protein